MKKKRYDLYAESVITDFEHWLEDNPTGVWYGNDGFNCPWRAFVRSKGYNVGYMGTYSFNVQSDTIPFVTLHSLRNPIFAQEFSIILDNMARNKELVPPEYKAFPVSAKDCIAILEQVKERGKENGF